MRAAHLGRSPSAATRAKMSAAAKRRVARGIRPPVTDKAWSAADDKLVWTLPQTVAAKRVGRSYDSVASRRWRLPLAGKGA